MAECRFGWSQEFTMAAQLEIYDVTDGQKGVIGVFNFNPGP
jgi:hypothetical protein